MFTTSERSYLQSNPILKPWKTWQRKFHLSWENIDEKEYRFSLTFIENIFNLWNDPEIKLGIHFSIFPNKDIELIFQCRNKEKILNITNDIIQLCHVNLFNDIRNKQRINRTQYFPVSLSEAKYKTDENNIYRVSNENNLMDKYLTPELLNILNIYDNRLNIIVFIEHDSGVVISDIEDIYTREGQDLNEIKKTMIDYFMNNNYVYDDRKIFNFSRKSRKSKKSKRKSRKSKSSKSKSSKSKSRKSKSKSKSRKSKKSKRKSRKRKSAKYERCVLSVKSKQSKKCVKKDKWIGGHDCVNPWAVCTAKVGRY